MRFLASKKLSDNHPIRWVVLWTLFVLSIAIVLNLAAKGIELGLTPTEWITAVNGDPNAFIEPILFSELLLKIHADLFGLIVTFILVASLYVRTSRSKRFKILLFILLLFALLLYPAALISAPFFGDAAVVAGVGGFVAFHFLILFSISDLLIAMALRRM